MNYKLNTDKEYSKTKLGTSVKRFIPLLYGEKKRLSLAFVALIVTNGLNLATPFVVGRTIDTYIKNKDISGVLQNAAMLFGFNLIILVSSYLQTINMGSVGQAVLFKLRRSIFGKLQELPIVFFNQNKAGDLISRINSDTDNLNQFFSQFLVQFVGRVFTMLGAIVLLLGLNFKLGAIALIPAIVILILTRLLSGAIRKKNTTSLQSIGGLSAQIQESLDNFKIIVAFNRRDYFRKKFEEVNVSNYKKAMDLGTFNNILPPTYTLLGNLSQLIVLSVGIGMIITDQISAGSLVAYLGYVTNFYDPVKQIAGFWNNFLNSVSSWDRISEILNLSSNLTRLKSDKFSKKNANLLEFDSVSFEYDGGKKVLDKVSFGLKSGKTYALVGPTGGGKTTTASLMARLFDPTSGKIFLNGVNIKSFTEYEISKKVGFILQEPFLFAGNLKDNILYGSEKSGTYGKADLLTDLQKMGLGELVDKFDLGLDTPVSGKTDTISLGQKQIIAFIRAVYRQPELLILDEASANIDTVTEKLLDTILEKLDKNTTKVVIAHRLNTISNADEIFFVNAGKVEAAGTMEHAVKLLMQNNRAS